MHTPYNEIPFHEGGFQGRVLTEILVISLTTGTIGKTKLAKNS